MSCVLQLHFQDDDVFRLGQGLTSPNHCTLLPPLPPLFSMPLAPTAIRQAGVYYPGWLWPPCPPKVVHEKLGKDSHTGGPSIPWPIRSRSNTRGAPSNPPSWVTTISAHPATPGTVRYRDALLPATSFCIVGGKFSMYPVHQHRMMGLVPRRRCAVVQSHHGHVCPFALKSQVRRIT